MLTMHLTIQEASKRSGAQRRKPDFWAFRDHTLYLCKGLEHVSLTYTYSNYHGLEMVTPSS